MAAFATHSSGFDASDDRSHTIVVAKGSSFRQFTITGPMRWSCGIAAAAVLAVCIGLPAWSLNRSAQTQAGAIASRADLRHGYESRIADLRARLDRATSRRALSENLVETRMAELVERQATLKDRYARLALRVERAEAVGALPPDVPVPTRAPNRTTNESEAAVAGGVGGPFLEPTGLLFGNAPLRSTSTGLPPMAAPSTDRSASPQREAAPSAPPEARLAAFDEDLAEEKRRQMESVRDLARTARLKAERLSAALSEADIAITDKAEPARGGPFVPDDGVYDNGEDFETMLGRLDFQLDRLQRVNEVTKAVPTRLPFPLSDQTSGFGPRRDPFLDRAAFHTGIDFAERRGTPIHASGNGRVIEAGRAGGYGNRVTIDHGHGLTSRYAHMSRIDVHVGDTVDAGDVVGAVGSTGRSTGPHLHFEVRKDDKPVNPERYRRLGLRLAELRD